GHGWDYRALQVAADDPDATADELGTAIVDGFLAQATESGTEGSVTLSLIDLTQMPAVDEALGTFSAALVERSVEVAPVIGRSRPASLAYGKSPDPAQDTFMFDLGDLAAKIGIEALDVSDQADALQRAINDAVVHKVAGPAAGASSGLSIYFPPAEHFAQAYESIETGGWTDFLASYYGAGEAIPEERQPTFTGDGEVFFDEDGLNIIGTFDLAAEENLSSATINYGLINDDGSVTLIGDEFGEVATDGSGQAIGIYDLTVLTITDGEDTAYAYLSLAKPGEDSELFTIDVPMAYYAPEDVDGETYQDVLLSLTANIEGDIVNETYYAYNGEVGTYGEMTADPEGIIVPQVLQVDAEGNQEWTATTDVGLYADLPNLAYELEPLESGTELYVELVVEDFGGNSDFVSSEVAVP
ncbi:MAG: clostripain-related cysteine peptidase, partial [Actinomycetota bacterium]|nr:clostripain-related cysteine peptidase [Actinomycetota bacterium]